MERNKETKNYSELVSKKIVEYKEKSLKSKANLFHLWNSKSNASVQLNSNEQTDSNPQNNTGEILNLSNSFEELAVDVTPSHPPSHGNTKETKSTFHNKANDRTPAQLKLQQESACLTAEIVALSKRKESGLFTSDMRAELKKKREKLSSLQKKLCVKRRDMFRKRKSRHNFKAKLSKICDSNPDVKKALKIRNSTGRPRLEVEQPELLKTIIAIAIHGSASHDKRREDMFRSIRTLTELKEKLNDEGFQISRAATYLRLLPRRSNTQEGKRHVTTVPVRLCKTQNDLHAQHTDSSFATISINYLEELASFLGPNQVTFISQDDKARVPIGVTAANKQTPLLMHVEYRVKLADHDWVKASRHKLIPSVYAGIKIKDNGLGNRTAVGYSGPTFITIRSGKHSTSNALTHARDLDFLYDNVPEFDAIMKCKSENGFLPKPVLIIMSDGGPDENPRYEKVITVAVHHFIKRDLDALFIGTNAPGRSCFNRVERRMAPLSRDLCGLVLPHDEFGNHLNSQNETIDIELEMKNFAKAGEILAEVWSENMIDKYPTVAHFVSETESELAEDLMVRDCSWWDTHIEFGQYLLQIVKCDDRNCCKPRRSSLFTTLKNGKIPPPLPLNNIEGELKLPVCHYEKLKVDQFAPLFLNCVLKKEFQIKSFDAFCPSVQSKIQNRTCSVCAKYFSATKYLTEHKKIHKKDGKNAKNLNKNENQRENETVIRKLRPKRIAAVRAREALAIINYDDEMEDAEWHRKEDLDLDGLDIPQEETTNGNIVMPVETCLYNEWSEDV
ncbi:uncharacterized protein LOC119070532 [Bradysia coprophila]|uniref:uncharacterized protein LOC119070532 n=1 Tax=Bradysia coprophila TaxID=38358 RepID=UPI00187DBCE3|nr:uncharacterized protein LOC119070532 [Bradysia coprophila]